MYKYEVRCSVPDCEERAVYKIAARWSDGRFNELKTYGHACRAHVGDVFRTGELRRAVCPQVAGETVGETAVYKREGGWVERGLVRDQALEGRLRSWGSGNEGV